MDSISTDISLAKEPEAPKADERLASQVQKAQPSSIKAQTDAVSVGVSSVVRSQVEFFKNATTGGKASEEATRVDTGLSREELEKTRKKLERTINSTDVKFDVSIAENGDSEFYFQVVEKESGRVIRQFPPDKVSGQGDLDAQELVRAGQIFEAAA